MHDLDTVPDNLYGLDNVYNNLDDNLYDLDLILKWFNFLSFAQNWPICEGLKFSLLKMDDFPFSGVSAPGTP